MSGDAAAEPCDVAIVGGGPAGLAAAATLRALGVRSVVVLERESEAGGVPRHCAHYPYGLREFRRLLKGPDYARRLAARTRAAGARIMTGATALALRPGPTLSVLTADGVHDLPARRVLLCTGVRERTRAARMIGGAKPGGVVSTGTLQGMIHLHGLRPFRRPVVLGTELVSFSALLTCRAGGARPAAMVEPGPQPVAGAIFGLYPRLIGVPLLLGADVVAVHGVAQVQAVEVAAGGTRRMIEADGLIVTGQFQPEATLVRESGLAWDARTGGPAVDGFGRCSDPTVFAAGNLLRPVETAGWCWAEGVAVAHAIADSLAGRLPDPENAAPVRLRGDALRYVTPQRLCRSATGGRLQLRLTRPARGRLSLRIGGVEVWRRDLASAPERRILVPLPSSIGDGAVEVALEEHRG